MSDWIPLDADVLEQGVGEVKRLGASRAEEFPSPYDVPEAIRAVFDPVSERLTIELKYLGDEPRHGRAGTSRVDLSLGRNSHRVYGITVDLHGNPQPPRGVVGLVNEALNRMAETYKGKASHYGIAKQALRYASDRLLHDVLAPSRA